MGEKNTRILYKRLKRIGVKLDSVAKYVGVSRAAITYWSHHGISAAQSDQLSYALGRIAKGIIKEKKRFELYSRDIRLGKK